MLAYVGTFVGSAHTRQKLSFWTSRWGILEITPDGVVAQAKLAYVGTFVGSAQFTPNGVGRKQCLLLWVPVRGLCPHPQGNDSLDLSWGS